MNGAEVEVEVVGIPAVRFGDRTDVPRKLHESKEFQIPKLE